MRFLRTEIIRATCTQELQLFLPALDNACSLRQVQVVVPSSPQVFTVLDASKEDLGMNKNFNWPAIHPGQVVDFVLGPKQTLALGCATGTALRSSTP